MNTEKIHIRKANLVDLPKLLEFEQKVIDAERPFSKNIKEGNITYYDLKHLLSSDNAELLLAECDGKTVASGYAKIRQSKPYYKHPYHSYLGFMYVDPQYRGQGVNRLIIDVLSQWSKSKGLCEIFLDVYDGNTTAIRAYEKTGFSKHIIEMRLELEP